MKEEVIPSLTCPSCSNTNIRLNHVKCSKNCNRSRAHGFCVGAHSATHVETNFMFLIAKSTCATCSQLDIAILGLEESVSILSDEAIVANNARSSLRRIRASFLDCNCSCADNNWDCNHTRCNTIITFLSFS